jgi:nicotinamidase-related amidase
MILQPAHGRLTANNCAFILMDYQARLASTVSSMSGDTLMSNAINMAKVATTFSIPTILTTVAATSFGGSFLPKLQEVFPGLKPIDRATINPWDNSRVLTTIEKAGRNKLVVAGLWTDFGVSIFVLGALKVGYEVYIVVDSCGSLRSIIPCRRGTCTDVRIGPELHADSSRWRTNQISQRKTKRREVGDMVYSSVPITKKIPKKALIEHHPEARFEEIMRGEFFNLAPKKSLLLCQECPIRKQLAYFHGMN